MSHNPGADELRVRARLRQLVDGPAANPTPSSPPTSPRLPNWWDPKPHISTDTSTEPEPPQRPRDWLDDILDSTPTPTTPDPQPEPADEDNAENEPQSGQPKPTKKPKAKVKKKPRKKRHKTDHPAAMRSPRQSLLDAYDRIPRRIRWLIYHATAAGAGWWPGWVDWGTDTAAWFAAGNWTASSAWVLYGLGACACGLYRHSRRWAWPVAWCATVPVSSVAAGVLLYGTGYQP